MNKIPIIEKGFGGGIDFQSRSKKQSRRYLIFYFLGVFICFMILCTRLFHLTIVKGVYYRTLSDQNRTREIIIEPKRGQIIDRKGFVIAENKPADLQQPGERLFSKRTYYDPESFSHVIGYRQVADIDDVKNDSCLNKLKSGDKVGKKGIEKLYECDLRGNYGKKLIEIDATGKYKTTLSIAQPVDGKTIQLALDKALQDKAYSLIQGKKAVVVGMKPTTGEVLVLASAPSFNPQVFEDGNSKEANKYLTDENKPLFNRATEGTYPPGSTFKLVVAAGALEEKKINTSTTVEDKGFIEAGGIKFHNWYYLDYGRTEGAVDVYKALQRSNDIFFYTIGAKMGAEDIKSWAEKFGYQNKTGIGIEEREGSIPSPFWKEDVLNEKWYLGDTYNLSIGQGYVNSTPLQVAMSTVPFANDGSLCTPQLLKINGENGVKKQCKKLDISQDTLKEVREGMKRACMTGGTGYPFFDFKVKDGISTPVPTEPNSTASAVLGMRSIRVGCKTGTAESYADPKKPHAWFTVFAPFDKPEIVLTILVEEAGQGSDVAAPIAKEILTTYFERAE